MAPLMRTWQSALVRARIGYPAVALLLTVTLGTACNREQDSGGRGTVVISTAADADFLFPPLVTTTLGRTISEQLFEPLAMVGDSLNVIGDEGFVPQLADSWDWAPDSLSIAFHLNPHAHWHDGLPVRAADVRFSYRLYTDSALGSPAALSLTDIDSVSVRDSLTPVVWFSRRSPEQFYLAATGMSIMPEHVYGKVAPGSLASSELLRHPVGSGRFRFARWVPGSTIEIVSNREHYREPARLDRVVWTIAPDFNAAATRLLAGEADFFEAVRAEMLPKVKQTASLRVVSFPSFKYGSLAFNLHDPKRPGAPHPIFGDRGVRRALTMAVDRAAIVRNVFDTLAVPSVGPMVRAMPTTDTTIAQIPYDTIGAARLLDSLGWRDTNGDGVRERHGVPLAFTIVTPSSSRERGRIAVLLQDQFKRIGARVKVEPLEINTLIHKLGARDFDAMMETWSIDPNPGAIGDSWGSRSAATEGSTNHGGYASARFDAELDSAVAAPSLAAARPLYRRAYETLINDAPAIWLFEPRNVVGVHTRIHLAPLRADAWWAHLADWSIAPGDRIARDRVVAPAQGDTTASAPESATRER